MKKNRKNFEEKKTLGKRLKFFSGRIMSEIFFGEDNVQKIVWGGQCPKKVSGRTMSENCSGRTMSENGSGSIMSKSAKGGQCPFGLGNLIPVTDQGIQKPGKLMAKG